MSVRIRLARIGKKKAPFFRIVAVDKREKRDGKYLENIGTYNALTGEVIQFHVEKLNSWVGKGAIPSDTVKRITKNFEKKNKTQSATQASSESKKAVKNEKKEAAAVEAGAAKPEVEKN